MNYRRNLREYREECLKKYEGDLLKWLFLEMPGYTMNGLDWKQLRDEGRR